LRVLLKYVKDCRPNAKKLDGAVPQTPKKLNLFARLKLPVNTFSLRHEIIGANLPLGRDDAVADIGVGTGYSAFNFAPAVRELVGIDIAAPVIEFLRSLPRPKNLDFRRADICDEADETLKELAGAFDRVYAADVLEHVPSPEAFFRTVASLLKDNGLALITFPNTIEHGVTSFKSRSELTRQLERAGLEPLRLETVEPTYWLKVVSGPFVRFPLGVHRQLRRRPEGSTRGDEQTFDETFAFAFNRRMPWYRFAINLYFETVMAAAKIFPLVKTSAAPEDILGRRLLIIAAKAQ
jgi:2-polyprenyl-3-methyl-5-hydroxy-6-metoxy-1,4-benzoquinol methylase